MTSPSRKSLWLLGLLCCLALPARAAQLAIIIDDIGYNLSLGKRAADLPGDFTLAVLPFTPHGVELAERGHARGKEIMLHAPMSNEQQLPLGRGGLVTGMSRAQLREVLTQNLANIPHVRGVNNHMGSQLTQEADTMAWLMAELQQRQLYFVDSRTTAKTRAQAMAEQARLPNRRRDVFLDHRQDSAHIAQQLALAIATAQRQGSAVAIGHPYPQTLALLEQLPAQLAQAGVSLVRASVLMPGLAQLPQEPAKPAVASASCLAPPPSLWPTVPDWLDPFALPRLWGNP